MEYVSLKHMCSKPNSTSFLQKKKKNLIVLGTAEKLDFFPPIFYNTLLRMKNQEIILLFKKKKITFS